MTLSIRLTLQRGDFGLDLQTDIPGRGITAIFGPSGSGKTTLLRCIAGLERHAEGNIRFHGEDWQQGRRQRPPHQRPLGYVFQEASLFPHLTVLDNLLFGYRRIPPAERRMQPDDALRLLGLAGFERRMPATLSGGERQRVAIARALLASPRLLLMDEPLASLDIASRESILGCLQRLHAELDIPVLYVTHSPEEVARLADHLLLMAGGRLLASGPLNALLTQPALPLSQLADACAVLEGTLCGHDPHYHLSQVRIPGGELTVAMHDAPSGSAVRVRILARDVSLALEPATRSSILNCLHAHIVDITPDGDQARVLVRLACGGTHLLSRITRRSADQLGLQPGQPVYAQIKAVALMT